MNPLKFHHWIALWTVIFSVYAFSSPCRWILALLWTLMIRAIYRLCFEPEPELPMDTLLEDGWWMVGLSVLILSQIPQ